MKFDGSQMRKILEENNLSIIEVAQAADLNPMTLYRFSGNKDLSLKSKRKLESALSRLTARSKFGSKAIS